MDVKIGSRYRCVHGLCVAKMNSVDEWGDDPKDCILKELVVYAEQNDIKDWELVARVEPESVLIGEDGVDRGHPHDGYEVYRLPFPEDVHIRKMIIKSFIKFPKYFTT